MILCSCGRSSAEPRAVTIIRWSGSPCPERAKPRCRKSVGPGPPVGPAELVVRGRRVDQPRGRRPWGDAVAGAGVYVDRHARRVSTLLEQLRLVQAGEDQRRRFGERAHTAEGHRHPEGQGYAAQHDLGRRLLGAVGRARDRSGRRTRTARRSATGLASIFRLAGRERPQTPVSTGRASFVWGVLME